MDANLRKIILLILEHMAAARDKGTILNRKQLLYLLHPYNISESEMDYALHILSNKGIYLEDMPWMKEYRE